MEQQEKTLNPQESLRLIRETIDLAKNSFHENGFHFLLWGCLVVLCCVAHYWLDVVVQHPHPEMSWAAMTFIGLPVALIYEWRRGKRQKMNNLVHEWYGLVWLGFGISMLIAIPFAARNGLSPIPLVLALSGFATFMSGVLLRFRPLLLGAVLIWAGGLACLWLTPVQHLLVQAVVTAFGYLVPGYMLHLQSRRHHVQGT